MHKRPANWLLLVYILFVSTSCISTDKINYDLLIVDVNVVDIVNDQVIPNQIIGISGDSVGLVAHLSDIDLYTSINVIEGGGKFLMPGLWDNHVHFRGGESLIDDNRELLPLFLAYGVTTVRDAGGDMSDAVFEWRKQIREKKLVGPMIYSSGPKLDGVRPSWPGSIPVKSQTEVEKALDSLQELDVDFVKTYDGTLTAENYYDIIQEAESRNLKVTGHMPLSANLMTAVSYGLDGTEHLYYLLKACSPDNDSLAENSASYGMLPHLLESYDDQLAQQVFEELGSKEFYVTPTLHIGKTLANMLDVDHENDSLLSYLSADYIKTYQGRINSAQRTRDTGRGIDRSALGNRFRSMVVPMKEAEINIMAGSDCGVANSYVYPGESLIGELQELVAVGLTPAEALQSSIVNGAKFFDLQEKYSQIKAGTAADLLILDRNPLEDINNLFPLMGLILSGEIITNEELSAILETIKK